ncbi:MAG: NAD-glutamate dehydrogenase, partial [Nocardioides sp.]|nr:NAD-glutamate dehydrogenase [Nocardioides sp.]
MSTSDHDVPPSDQLTRVTREQLEEAAEAARADSVSASFAADLASVVVDYYRHVAPEEINSRAPRDLAGSLLSHVSLARSRPQGTADVRVVTPTTAQDGWSAGGRSVVEVVTDDMSFLVDSVQMELSRLGHSVHTVVHPQLSVLRDITGELQEVSGLDEHRRPHRDGAVAESWIHVEIDLVDDEEAAEIVTGVQRVLRDVREAVEDWPKMHVQALQVVEQVVTDPPPLDSEELRQGTDFLRWLADDHFTFLGYREYELVSLSADPDDVGLRAVPGTGLGILRSDRSLSSSFAQLPPVVRSKAREKALLVLAKANS